MPNPTANALLLSASREISGWCEVGEISRRLALAASTLRKPARAMCRYLAWVASCTSSTAVSCRSAMGATRTTVKPCSLSPGRSRTADQNINAGLGSLKVYSGMIPIEESCEPLRNG